MTLLSFGCDQDSAPDTEISTNPLQQAWTGPYGGVPAFDQMDLQYLQEAMEAGIAERLAEIDAIAQNEEAPSFDNTILAMERAGSLLNRVSTYYGIWSSNRSSADFRDIQAVLSPKLSEMSSKITQNEALFQRIEAVYQQSQQDPLPDDQQRVLDLIYNRFVMQGAKLAPEAKTRYAAINKELASLHNQFSNNVLADEEGYVIYISEDQIGGLPESFAKSAAKAAADRGKEGQYAITNTRSSMDPFLTFSEERELREEVWRTYYSRGDNGDEHDNNAIIAQILQLRNERVQLLGDTDYASWRLQDRMAQNADNAMDLLMKIWPAALARVEQEVADMQAVADAEGANITIEPWDYRFYAEKVRKQKYDLDSEEVKQYLQLNKLTEAMFFVAGELFNFEFQVVPEGSVPVFHEDVSVWEVSNKKTGEHIGLF
ncbi:MAG: M3 family metallopeptidase, partial [Bacteroidota bacterium]